MTSDFVATTTKTDAPPFSLIEHKGLLARLAEELNRTSREFVRDPRGFTRALFADDTNDLKRRRRIYIGLGGALVIHAVLLTVIAVIGWRNLTAPKEATGEKVHYIDLPARTNDGSTEAKSKAPRGNDGGGGGGGGIANSPAPTRGTPPPMSPTPQIVKPLAPSVEHPALPVMASIKGPESTPPAVNVPTGIPEGQIAEAPAPGVGKGDGIGGGKGPGAGNRDGGSAGRGSGDKNPNSGNDGQPDGTLLKDIPYNYPKPPGYVSFSWIRRATPMITPEAQAHKAAGRVLLRATFNADGTISDIETINQVDFMTESAIESLKRSKFRPASINGVPITVRRVPVYIDVHY
jgi:hypothetical protein